ncbi:MAG: hypothetical protein JSU79_01285 [Dehalococcoidales bacterium]|nr:MAG: hypothetical protein JSU79_01285 [Dehalococcoidales bacterium]
MRELTSTLLATQKQASGIPYVKIEASNKISGIVRLDWQKLYEGTEDDYYHSLTVPGDGSLVRVRISLPGSGQKLYLQKVTNPGPESDFSTWTYTGNYGCIAVAVASLGSEVLIFWVNTSQELYYIKSTDYGDNWYSPVLIDYTPSTSVGGLAAAYKPNGDAAVFFTDQDSLYVKKRIGGNWQSKTAWDKDTGNLSGVALCYGSDWNIAVSGEDAAGNYRIWSLVYGDDGEFEEGIWSPLEEFASAPSDGDYEFLGVFMDNPDVYRCLYTEKYSGIESYNRPFWSHSLVAAAYSDNLWREPIPFDFASEYGVAMAHCSDYCWLSIPSGVWRAGLVEMSVDLTPDVMSVRQETDPERDLLTVELRNDDGWYSSLPSPLDTGCQLEISPGYVTSQGNETSPGQSYILESYEYISKGGISTLFLYAYGGWSRIARWISESQFRFNEYSDEMNVKQILEFVLARIGFRLEVKSESSVITDFYPDFTVHPGINGEVIIRKLLSMAPDVVFFEGDVAYLVHPLSSDSSVYSYGQNHGIKGGRYRSSSWKLNRVTVEGYNTIAGEKIIKDSFAWEQICEQLPRTARLIDRNISTVGEAGERGEIYLRTAESEAQDGTISIPVNCGQQLYDVIDITDERAGMVSEKKRVAGLTLIHNPRKGEYKQHLALCVV